MLSPDLFRIVIDDILKNLENKGLNVYAYADDICILCQDLRQCKQAINFLNQKIKGSGLEINGNKSGILLLGGKKSLTNFEKKYNSIPKNNIKFV